MAAGETVDWRSFVQEYGYRAKASDLAFLLGRAVGEVLEERKRLAGSPTSIGRGFQELFALWHGRAPTDEEWPAPERSGRNGYAWQVPELALLATLVGTLGVQEIATVLTNRLRLKTGDGTAERSAVAVQLRTSKIGLQSGDVVGGLTTTEAGREIGSTGLVHHALKSGSLKGRRVGRLWVTDRGDWAAWKAARVLPPAGYVQLSGIRERLGFKSDRLSEFARLGYVPSAVRCTPCGGTGGNTQFGTWFIDPQVADRLLADRKAGKPMPWHGKPLPDNLAATYKKWQGRKHPKECETCKSIWGSGGEPTSTADFAIKYPTLMHGAKRHLTMVWTPGLTVAEVASSTGASESKVRRAIAVGLLARHMHKGCTYVTKTDSSRWGARGCPAGDSEKSWMCIETARKAYLFTLTELKGLVASGLLVSKTGDAGAARGVVYVLRQQCAQLREQLGFTVEEAARRVGVSEQRFRGLLEGVHWRGSEGIPLATVQAVTKRLESREGHSLGEAAEAVQRTEQWVKARIADGTVRVSRAKWDARRLYLTTPMLERLKAAAEGREANTLNSDTWLRVSEAAREAGVCSGTIYAWAEAGDLASTQATDGRRYHRESVRRRARSYWLAPRLTRPKRPQWLATEQAGSGTSVS